MARARNDTEFVVDLETIRCGACRQTFDTDRRVLVVRTASSQPKFFHEGCRAVTKRTHAATKFIATFSDKDDATLVANDIARHVSDLWTETKYAGHSAALVRLKIPDHDTRTPTIVVSLANTALIQSRFVVNEGVDPSVIANAIERSTQRGYRIFVECVTPRPGSETVVNTWMYRHRSKPVQIEWLPVHGLHKASEVKRSDAQDVADHRRWANTLCANQPFRFLDGTKVFYFADVRRGSGTLDLWINYGEFPVCQSREQQILYRTKKGPYPALIPDEYATRLRLSVIATRVVDKGVM